MVTLFTILDIYCEFMLHLLVFIYCQVMLPLFCYHKQNVKQNLTAFYRSTRKPREGEGLGRGPQSKTGWEQLV